MQKLAVAMVAVLNVTVQAQITFTDMVQLPHAHEDHGGHLYPGEAPLYEHHDMFHGESPLYEHHDMHHDLPHHEDIEVYHDDYYEHSPDPHLYDDFHLDHHDFDEARYHHSVPVEEHHGLRGVDVDPFLGEGPYRFGPQYDRYGMPVDPHFTGRELLKYAVVHDRDERHIPHGYYGFRDPELVPPRHHEFEDPYTYFRSPTYEPSGDPREDVYHAQGTQMKIYVPPEPAHIETIPEDAKAKKDPQAEPKEAQGDSKEKAQPKPAEDKKKQKGEKKEEEEASNSYHDPPVNFFMDPYHTEARHNQAGKKDKKSKSPSPGKSKQPKAAAQEQPS